MTAALGIPLIGFAALAVDVSIWEGNVGMMQGAADQAALAAGLAMLAGKSAAQMEAKGVAAANGFVDGTGNVFVTPNVNTATNAIEVVITQTQTTFLSGLSLGSPPVASVRAVATPAPASTCILALATTGTAINSSGTGNVNAASCNIYVNSTSACGLNISGTGNITSQDIFLGGSQTQAICTPGTGRVSATQHFGAPAASDPYASRTMPPPSTPCTNLDTSKTTFSPGTYCGGVSLSGTQPITLNAGVYIFDGGNLNVSGTSSITGNNVTLVFTSSKPNKYGTLNLTGTGSINLTAPIQGATDGMAIWIDGAGGKPLTSSGTSPLNITGAIYAPGSAVTWSGTGSSQCTQLVALTVSLPGTASLNHNCNGVHVQDVPGATGYKLTE